MYHIYGIYKQVRNASWQFLIDNKVSSFPVDLRTIVKSMGIKVRRDDGTFLNDNKGATFFSSDTCYIVTAPNLTAQEARYTVAHELGHITLGHTLFNGSANLPKREEYEAERFAISILAPACVLWGLDLHTPEEISTLCNISSGYAIKRAERMAKLYERNKFLTSQLECQVFQQFKPYIDSMR